MNNTNEEKPLLSVITICFNDRAHLEETMQGVLTQDYPELEYIVIDGGSTDGTVDIIKKYQDRLSYWVSEPDSGISDAINKGIAVSKGSVIGIIHAGDSYTPGAASTAARALFGEPDSGFIFGDLEYVNKRGEHLFTVMSDKHYIKKIHYTMPTIQHPTVFIRKQVYDRCGAFDLSYKTAMDYELFLRITTTGVKGLYVNKTLARMRLGGLSYSNFYSSYKEVARASIRYGYNPVLAKSRLCLKGLGGLARVGMEKLGLHGLIKVLRKALWGIKYR